MTQQNQIIAIEKGVKSRAKAAQSELYKAIQKPSLFNGQTRTFEKINDETQDVPEEKTLVQIVAKSAIKDMNKVIAEYLDVSATRDWGNTVAKANVTVDGNIIIENAPVTFLLFLEKELNELHTFVSKIPTLDPAHVWTTDENSDLFYAEPVRTQRTQKVQEAITLAQATKEHPAQAELITVDKVIGFWKTQNMSGALRSPEKNDIIERIEKLQKAVKSAREKGNSVEVDKQEVGDKILSYIFG